LGLGFLTEKGEREVKCLMKGRRKNISKKEKRKSGLDREREPGRIKCHQRGRGLKNYH